MENKVEELLKLHNLPSWEILCAELGQLDIEKDTNIVQLVLEKLSDKVNVYVEFLENVLQPDSSICSMNESTAFNNEDRKELYTILKSLLYWERLSLKVDLDGTEEDLVHYFNSYFKFWQEIKKEIKPFLDKAIHVWKVTPEEVKFEGYFG